MIHTHERVLPVSCCVADGGLGAVTPKGELECANKGSDEEYGNPANMGVNKAGFKKQFKCKGFMRKEIHISHKVFFFAFSLPAHSVSQGQTLVFKGLEPLCCGLAKNSQ